MVGQTVFRRYPDLNHARIGSHPANHAAIPPSGLAGGVVEHFVAVSFLPSPSATRNQPLQLEHNQPEQEDDKAQNAIVVQKRS